MRIDQDRRRCCGNVDRQLDVFADDARDYFAETRDRIIQVDSRQRGIVLAAEGQELAGEGRSSFGRLANLFKVVVVPRLIAMTLQQKLGAPRVTVSRLLKL